MGAWGTGPFENDSALDFCGDLYDFLEKAMLSSIKSKDESELFAALEVYFGLPKMDYRCKEVFETYVPKLIELDALSGWRDQNERDSLLHDHIKKWSNKIESGEGQGTTLFAKMAELFG